MASNKAVRWGGAFGPTFTKAADDPDPGDFKDHFTIISVNHNVLVENYEVVIVFDSSDKQYTFVLEEEGFVNNKDYIADKILEQLKS